MKNIWFAAFAAVLMLGISAAATSSSSGAAIAVSDYSTIPSTVYSGTYAQLRLDLENTGSETADSVAVYYSYGSEDSYMSVGGIGSGSSTITSLPFNVPSDYKGSVIVLYLRIVFEDSGGTQMTYASIPISVSGRNSLVAEVTGTGPSELYPGDTVSVNLRISNIGENSMGDVTLAPESGSGIYLNGSSSIRLGDIESGGARNASLSLIVSSPSSYGRQMIPIVVTYEDAQYNQINGTVYAGPVNIMSSNTKWELSVVPDTSVEIGSGTVFSVSIKNRGADSDSAIVQIGSGDEFMPLGPSRIYFDSVSPGETKTANMTIGISSSVAAGYYNLPVSIISGNGQSWNGSVGVLIQATPELTITNGDSITLGSEGEVSITIANTGNSAIRSAYASVTSSSDLKVTASSSEFVGTLNVDDSYTLQPTVSAPAKNGEYPLLISVTFKDSLNQEKTVTKTVYITVGSSTGDSAGTPASNGNGTAMTGPGNGFSQRNASGIRVFGVDVIPIAAVVAVLGLAYFVWMKKFRRKKEEPKKEEQRK